MRHFDCYLMHLITRNISISACRKREKISFFPKGRQFHLRSNCSLSCDCTAVFLWKHNHEFVSSNIFNYKQTPKTHLCNPWPVFHWWASVEAKVWNVRPTSQNTFSTFIRKTTGNLGKPTIFVSCGCSWGLRRWLGTEEDWAPAAPVLSKRTLVEVSKFRPLGRWGWNNWSDPDLGLVREATKQMRNGYEAEIRVKLDSAAACLLLLRALVLSVLASTCWCN